MELKKYFKINMIWVFEFHHYCIFASMRFVQQKFRNKFRLYFVVDFYCVSIVLWIIVCCIICMYFFNKLDFYIIRGAVRNGRGSTPVRCSTTTTKATCTIMKSVTVPLGTSSPRQVCFDSCLFFMQIICDIFEYFYVYKLKNVPPIKL